MIVRRLQGLALIVSAVCFVIGLFGPQSIALIGPQATAFYAIVGILLFIVGIPAVNSAQPTGWIGLAGIALLILASLIPLLFRLNRVPAGLENSLSLASAIAGMLGALITGWITTRENVFPAWLGWVFIAHGVLNFFGGWVNLAPAVLPLFLTFIHAVVLVSYGYLIYQLATRPAIVKRYGTPLH